MSTTINVTPTRTTFSTVQVRACDLRGDDVIAVRNGWARVHALGTGSDVMAVLADTGAEEPGWSNKEVLTTYIQRLGRINHLPSPRTVADVADMGNDQSVWVITPHGRYTGSGEHDWVLHHFDAYDLIDIQIPGARM